MLTELQVAASDSAGAGGLREQDQRTEVAFPLAAARTGMLGESPKGHHPGTLPVAGAGALWSLRPARRGSS